MSTSVDDVTFTRLGAHMAIAVEGVDLHRAPDDRLAKNLHQALLDQAAVLPDWQVVDRADPADRSRRAEGVAAQVSRACR